MSSVSVIIPSYNRAHIIGETIDNMLSQSLPPLEVIVVDDGSTDNSVDVIKGYGNKVHLITQSNKGPGAARNAGLAVAKGDYIQFMDSDDLASLNKLEIQTKILDKNKADIVYGPWLKAWLANDSVRMMDVVIQQRPLPSERTPLEWFLTDWSMVFQQCLVRKSLLQKIGGYREDMRTFEDGDLFVKLLLGGAKLAFENQTLTLYRLDDFGKLTASGEANKNRALDKARFFLFVLSLSEKNQTLKAATNHTAFKLNVWNAVKDLKATGSFNEADHNQLAGFLSIFHVFYNFRLALKRKRAGIQKRLHGHRWPHCYQVGVLNSLQSSLISDMGRVLKK